MNTQIVYAHQTCRLDGVSDDTAALQALLDLAVQGPLMLVIDGPTVISSMLKVHSYTAVVLPPGAQVSLAAHANCPMIGNANPVECAAGFAGIVDHDITLLGGNWFGNGANQVHDVGSGTNSQFTVGHAWYGVRNLVYEDVTVTQAAVYAVHAATIDGMSVLNLTVDMTGRTLLNGDSLHLNGPWRKVFVRNVRAKNGNDDVIALNAADGLGQSPYVQTFGNASDTLVDGVVVENCLSALRLLSLGTASKMTNITLRNFSGTTTQYIGVGNALDPSSNAGDFENVLLENFSIDHPAYAFGGLPISGTWKNLTLKNFTRNSAQGNTSPILFIQQAANITAFRADGLQSYEPATTSAATNLLVIQGTVNGLTVVNTTWKTNGTNPFAAGAALIGTTATASVPVVTAYANDVPSLIDDATRAKQFVGEFRPVLHRSSFTEKAGTAITALVPEFGHAWSTSGSWLTGGNATTAGAATWSTIVSSDASYAITDIGPAVNFTLETSFSATANAAQYWIKLDGAAVQSGVLVDMLVTGALIGYLTAGVFTTVTTLPATITAGVRHTVRITLAGNVVSVTVDGVALGTATIPDPVALAQTKLALNAASGATVNFGEILVRRNN